MNEPVLHAEPEAGYVGYPNVDLLPKGLVRVARDLKYWSEQFSMWVIIRNGFISDLLSVPWFMRWLLPKGGEGRNAAILHDFLCDDGKLPPELRMYPSLSSKQVHLMFREALIVSDIPKWRRKALFAGVWVFGPRFDAVDIDFTPDLVTAGGA